MPKSITPARAASVRAPSATSRRRVLPELTRKTVEPLYRQLVSHLRDDIIKGVFPVGSQLPTEEDLAVRFNVSRHTVREALRQLRADGLVSSRQGSGTTVMPPPPSTPFNVHRVASIDELIAYANDSRYVVDSSQQVPSHAIVLDEIDLPEGSQWLQLQGFRWNDASKAAPICWTEVFVAKEYAGVERLMARQRGPIWRLIEDMYGERLVEVEQMLRTRIVPDELADGLHVDKGAVVVEVRRTYTTSADKIAEISVNYYPADKFRFTMKLRRA